MGQGNFPLQAFNRGEIGRHALGRVDVDRLRLSAEEMVNFVPMTVGPMTLRPGTAYVSGTRENLRSLDIPFVYSVSDTALLECTAGGLVPLVNEARVVRPAHTSTFEGGRMVNSYEWTAKADGGGAVVVDGGAMTLTCASIGETVSLASKVNVHTPGVEHAFRITVAIMPVTLSIGLAIDGEEFLKQTVLGVGVHSIACVPTQDCWLTFTNANPGTTRVEGAYLEPGGTEVTLAAFWTEAELPLLRYEQSGDVIFVACIGHAPRRIERRSASRSWSLIVFANEDGPFQAFPTKDTHVKVDGNIGRGFIRAKAPLFKPEHVGSLFQAFTPDYNNVFSLAGEQAFMPAIRMSGVKDDRTVGYEVTGEFAGTWELQRSLTSADAGFFNVARGTGPLPITILNDGLDNSVCWYRLGFVEYESGRAVVRITYRGGGRTAVARIERYIDARNVEVQFLQPGSSDTLTKDWRLSDWSEEVGWPSAVAINDGRLTFAGRDRFWTSVSDSYGSFAQTIDGSTVGDSSAISRSVGYGPVAIMNWILSLTRLIIGSEGSEISVRSSALDAPLTPAGGVTIRDCSTQGSARVAAVKVDKRGLFVQKSGRKLYQLAYDVQSQDYEAANLNRLHPELFLKSPIVRLAVQRQPDTRIHCLRQDGTVAVLTFEPADEVEAWWQIDTDGFVEDICVLPDAIEDRVYYTVRRKIGGQQVRCRERFARLDQCRGGPISRLADSHVIYQGGATKTLTTHLAGRTVCVWGDGKDLGQFPVKNGSVTLPVAVSNAVVGLPYKARFKSAKLAYAASAGTALNQVKRVVKVGLMLSDMHPQGLQYGQSFEVMDDLPLIENGGAFDLDTVRPAYDEPMISVPGEWDTDARLCLTAAAPRPATVMACSIKVETNG